MNQHQFHTRILVFAVLSFCSQNARAQRPVQYYKAGDVGIVAISIEIPARVDANTTIFTARANDERVYLLYVQSAQSVAERVTRAMLPSPQPRLTPEQRRKMDELAKQTAELYKKRAELSRLQRDLSTRLKEAYREKAEALEALKAEPEASKSKTLLEQAEKKIRQLSPDHSEMPAKAAELDVQLNVIRREQQEIWSQVRRPAMTEQKPEIARSLAVFGRFQGSGRVKVTVFGRDSGELLARPKSIASVELDLPSADGGNAELLDQWATQQAKEYVIRALDSPYTSYYQYWLLQSRQKYGLSDSLFGSIFQGGTRRRGRTPDLYAMTTGALAIQESLQLEEMTGRRDIPLEHNVAISSLQGPDIKSHPFDKMLKSRKPKTFAAAELVPHDNYYCHFTSISKEIAASDMFKQWGTSLLRAATISARDSDLPSRYMNQLCIDVSALTRLFGDLVIGEIALTGGDPFMKEGSDMAAIIHVKSRRVFDTMMKRHADAVLGANPEAAVSASKYKGVPVRSIVTPDRRISSHSAYLGDYAVYSNSMDTLRLIVDTHARRRKSMAENLDLLYMRTIFPATDAAEDGFIYLSDSFIRKILSPRWKIEAQRRIVCQNHLRMIANAATMHRTETLKMTTIKTLIEQKYLSEETLWCPDGGTYSLSESGRAFCTAHNCLQYCTPISDIAMEQVAEAEAEDYRQFVRRYSSYWSRFFDPIGIRFRFGNRVEAETCILPLIENSIYNQLREIVGGEPVRLESQVLTDRTIVSIGGKLNVEGEQLNEILHGLLESSSSTVPEIREFLGDSLSINFYDSDVLFTFAEDGMQMLGGLVDLEEQLIIGLIASSINLPVCAVLDVKDEEQAGIFIRETLKVLQRQFSADQRRRGFLSFDIEPYSAGQYEGHAINTLVLRILMVKFRLHYAIASNRLIVSTKRYVLEEVLDSLDRRQSAKEIDGVANVRLSVRPRAFDDLRPITRMGWEERMREACLKNIEPVRVLVECHGATEQTLNAASREVEGVTLRCPSGGLYKYDSTRGIVYCSHHGNRNHPRQPAQVEDEAGLLDILRRMTDLSVELRFTEEGIMTKVTFELEAEKNEDLR